MILALFNWLLKVCGYRPYASKSDPLAREFPDERFDLEIHVDVCSRRYGAQQEAIAASSRQSATNTLLIIPMLFLSLYTAITVGLGPELVSLFKIFF